MTLTLVNNRQNCGSAHCSIFSSINLALRKRLNALATCLPGKTMTRDLYLSDPGKSGESYQEALEEAKRESPHQHERMQDPVRKALEEPEGGSPHQRDLQERSRRPYEEALEENQRERP